MRFIGNPLLIRKRIQQRLTAFMRQRAERHIQAVCRQEFEQQAFRRFNERPVEFAFVFKHLERIYPKTILDVGTGETALPHLLRNCGCLVTAIDNVTDYWKAGMRNRHYHIIDDDITNSRLKEQFELITCISVLEHIKNYDAAISNMFMLLAPGGHLILTFPYTEHEYIKDVYELPGSSYGQTLPFVCQSYSRSEIDRFLSSNNGIIVDQEYWQFWDGLYWTVGNQIIPPRQVASNDSHQISCLLIQKALT